MIRVFILTILRLNLYSWWAMLAWLVVCPLVQPMFERNLNPPTVERIA